MRARRGAPSYEPEPAEAQMEQDPLALDRPGPSSSSRTSSSRTNSSTNSKPPTEDGEVVLNARGMPARQRKRNRLYFDEDVMVTPESMARMKGKANLKKVKPEPVEVEDLGEEEDEYSIDIEYPDPVLQEVELEEEVGEELEEEEYDEPEIPVPQFRAKPKKSPRARQSAGNSRARAAAARPRIKIPAAKRKPRVKTPEVVEEVQEEIVESDHGEYEVDYVFNTSPPPKPKKKQTARRTNSAGTKKLKSPARIKRDPDAPPTPSRYRNERDRENDKARQYQERDRIAREMELQEERMEIESTRREARRERAERIKMERDSYIHVTAKPRSRRESSPHPDEYEMNNLPHDLIPIETVRGGLDKKTAQDISIRLRNLLKLPKAHKWVCYEWFYSNIDKVLFEGENDFQICLKESFPQLKSRKMSRVEWCKIRRLMGKPRRCSQAFFDEEREELARRRQKIRMIQQRKVTDFNYKELPDEIPLQLVIGTKVTSRLRKPQDGLFTGTIEGVDTSNNTYRITFDRPGLGTHSIPDYEVLSNDPPETVSTSSFALKIPRRNCFSSGSFKFANANLGEDMAGFPKSPFPVDGMLGGFPIRLLDMIVRLSKLLKAKREKILQLKELNVEAEKMRSYGKLFNDDYRSRYARCVLDLESMNKEMSLYLEGIQQYCLEIAPDHGANQMIIPEHVQESCRQEALLIVDTYNTKQNRSMVHGSKTLSLISNLTSMMLQVKALSAGDRNLYELKSIKDSLRDMKASLEGKNVQLFQDRIEIPMNRIQAGLTMSLSSLRNTY